MDTNALLNLRTGTVANPFLATPGAFNFDQPTNLRTGSYANPLTQNNSNSGAFSSNTPQGPGSWQDDWRATTPGYSFNVNSGWSYADPAQTAAAQQAAQQAAAQKTQDDTNRAIFDQQIGDINSGLGRLGPQLNVAKSNYESQYNDALSQLLNAQQRAQTGYNTTSQQNSQDYNLGKTNATNAYNTSKQQTAQDYITSKNTIGANAGSSLNGLLRLLGSRGAGGGSAFNIAAPQAVARQATLQRNDVGQTFGRNQQALDTSYNQGISALDTNYNRNKSALDTNLQNYLSDVNTQQTGLGNQLHENENALQASSNLSKADLLSKLAGLTTQRWAISGLSGPDAVASGQTYLDQANTLRSQADQLGALTPHNINLNLPNYQAPAYNPAPAYQAPSLSSYTVNPNAAPTYQGQSPSNDFFSPYLQSLLGKKQTSLA